MVEQLSELVPVRALFQEVPSGRKPGRAVHPAIVTRAIKRGNLSPDGRRIRLAAKKICGSWFTTRADFDRWIAEVSGRDAAGQEMAPADDRRARSAAEAAGRELERLGC